MYEELGMRVRQYCYERRIELGLTVDACEAEILVDYIGGGESYFAWSVRNEGVEKNENALVVRVARRPLAELPRPMEAEFAALNLVPTGIGPRPIKLELESSSLGVPFMVESFVKGRALQISDLRPEISLRTLGQWRRYIPSREKALVLPTRYPSRWTKELTLWRSILARLST